MSCRVLYGKMHVKSYDWADPAAEDTLPREARRVLNRVLTASDEPAVLFPASGGNIHQFTAVTDCAVLDLLSPPYSTDDGEPEACGVWLGGKERSRGQGPAVPPQHLQLADHACGLSRCLFSHCSSLS